MGSGAERPLALGLPSSQLVVAATRKKGKAVAKPSKRHVELLPEEGAPSKKGKGRKSYPPPPDSAYTWVSGDVHRFSSTYTSTYLREHVKIYEICITEFAPYVNIRSPKTLERVYIHPKQMLTTIHSCTSTCLNYIICNYHFLLLSVG